MSDENDRNQPEPQRYVALPNIRQIETDVDRNGMCKFTMRERFDYIPEPDRTRVVEATKASFDAWKAAGLPLEVSIEGLWVVLTGTVPKQMAADLLICECLPESSIGSATLADLFAGAVGALTGLFDRGEVAKMLTAEDGMKAFGEEKDKEGDH